MSAVAGLAAVVTGGASGIGAATTELLARQGARVVALDTQPAVNPPAGVVQLRCDVTDRDEVTAAVDRAAARLDGIDILVNNAGIGAVGDVAANGDDEWHAVLDVNVVGLARVTAAALPHLRRSAHAAIVNTCSVVAVVGFPQRALYAASKGAVHALTLAMAADHLAEGIRVNAVLPGTTDTPWVDRLLQVAPDPATAAAALRARQPMGRLVTPQEVAAAIGYLAGRDSGATTGTVLPVDGGLLGLRLPR